MKTFAEWAFHNAPWMWEVVAAAPIILVIGVFVIVFTFNTMLAASIREQVAAHRREVARDAVREAEKRERIAARRVETARAERATVITLPVRRPSPRHRDAA